MKPIRFSKLKLGLSLREWKHTGHCLQIGMSSPSIKIPTPLFERPLVHSIDRKVFHLWKKSTEEKLFEDSKKYNIPLSELKIELKWLIEDTSSQETESEEHVATRLTLEEVQSIWRSRLEDRIPIQYLTNTAHWRDVVLAVGKGVLVPRPETELLIDLAESEINKNPSLLQYPWADLGTGSGAIAVCLARLLSQKGGKEVLATDIDSTCLAYARFNAKRLNIDNGIKFHEGDWFNPLTIYKERLAGIISNPPYIPSSEIKSLQPEVRNHEPRIALDGGPNGNEPLITILKNAPEYLIDGGVILIETNGPYHTLTVHKLIDSPSIKTRFSRVEIIKDLNGIDRFILTVNSRKRS